MGATRSRADSSHDSVKAKRWVALAASVLVATTLSSVGVPAPAEAQSTEQVQGAEIVDNTSTGWRGGSETGQSRISYWDDSDQLWYSPELSDGSVAFRSVSVDDDNLSDIDLSGLPGLVVNEAPFTVDAQSGDLFIVGSPDVPGNRDVVLSRVTETGGVVWQRSFEDDRILSLYPTATGDLLIYHSEGVTNTRGSLEVVDPATGDRIWYYQETNLRQYPKVFDDGIAVLRNGPDEVVYLTNDGVVVSRVPYTDGLDLGIASAEGDIWFLPTTGTLGCRGDTLQVVSPEAPIATTVTDFDVELGFCPLRVVPAPDRTAYVIGQDPQWDPNSGQPRQQILVKIDSTGSELWRTLVLASRSDGFELFPPLEVDTGGNLLTIDRSRVPEEDCFAGTRDDGWECWEATYSRYSGNDGALLGQSSFQTSRPDGTDHRSVDIGRRFSFTDGTIFDQFTDGVIYDQTDIGLVRIELRRLGRPWPQSRYRIRSPIDPTAQADTNGDGRVRVAVLGDSYISGVGAPFPGEPYDLGTDDMRIAPNGEPINRCWRSTQHSWGPSIARRLGADGADLLFAACLGAKSSEVTTRGQYPYSPSGVHGGLRQVETLQNWTAEEGPVDVVLLSIGGNDVGFAPLATDCVMGPCLWFAEDRIEQQAINERFLLVETYQAVLDAARAQNPNAEVWVTNYPSPIAGRVCQDVGYIPPFSWVSGLGADEAEQVFLRDRFLGRLNESISWAANAVGVDALDLSTLGVGHELCVGNEPYFWGVSPGSEGRDFYVDRRSFHPNQAGYAEFGRQLWDRYGDQFGLSTTAPAGGGGEPIPLPTSSLAVTPATFNPQDVASGEILYSPGDTVRLQVRDIPTGTYSLVVRSLPVVLGQIDIGTEGAGAIDFEIPAWLAPHAHWVTLEDGSGTPIATAVLNVAAEPSCQPSDSTMDADGDGISDQCDLLPTDGPVADYDGDEVLNGVDNCILQQNPAQTDSDGDGLGDACDPSSGADRTDGYRPITEVEDVTPPVVTGTPSVSPNGAGWLNDAVTISWSVADPEPSAGLVDPAPADTPANIEGTTVYESAEVCDVAGNCGVGSLVLSIDLTAPTVTLNAPADGSTVPEEEFVDPTCEASDTLSGIDGECVVEVVEDEVAADGRVLTATATAFDVAGNTASVSSTFTVTGDDDPELTCEGLVATIVGTDGNDRLVGTQGDDVIVALGGDDRVIGRGGNDVICLGEGRDRAWGNNGDDKIIGGPGRDSLHGGRGVDFLDGGEGRDWLWGGNDNDTLQGRDGNDVLYGGRGNDLIDGAEGNDWLAGNGGADQLNGGPGRDRIFGASGDDELDGGPDRDHLHGGRGTDTCANGEHTTSCEGPS